MSDKQQSPGFLNRWSARKRQVEQAQSTVSAQRGNELTDSADEILDGGVPILPIEGDAADDISAPVTTNDSTAEEADDGLVLTDADMPPIESLSSDSDLSVFFNKGVSASLKRAALRHVFLQPKYNIRDGLNDYDGDYTYFEPLGDTITSDMKWHTARKEADRLEAEARELEALQNHSDEQRHEHAEESKPESTEREQDELRDNDVEQETDEQHQLEERHVADEESPVEDTQEALLVEQLAFADNATLDTPTQPDSHSRQHQPEQHSAERLTKSDTQQDT